MSQCKPYRQALSSLVWSCGTFYPFVFVHPALPNSDLCSRQFWLLADLTVAETLDSEAKLSNPGQLNGLEQYGN